MLPNAADTGCVGLRLANFADPFFRPAVPPRQKDSPPAGAFAMVRVTVVFPKDRSTEAPAALAQLVDEARKTRVVQKVIDVKGLKGVNVATKTALAN